MPKTKKYGWLLGAGVLPLTALPIALSASQAAETGKIIFEGKVYDSIEKAASAYLQARRADIRPLVVVGDINKAVFDNKHNILNRSQLFDYVPARIRPAYVTRTGSLVSRPEVAAATFATPTNSDPRYTFPGAQTYYETEAEADNALKASGFLQAVPLAKISDPQDLRVNPKTLYFNATNKADLALVEQALLAAITSDDQAALREIEESYQKTLRPNKLGKDWAIKNFYGEVAPGAKLQVIDDEAGSHVDPALDFSQWAVQKAWLEAILPSGHLKSNGIFTTNGVTYDLRGDKPHVQALFDVNLLNGQNSSVAWQGVRLYYNERSRRNYLPIETGWNFSMGNSPAVASYGFVFNDDQSKIHTIYPGSIAQAAELGNAQWKATNPTDEFYLTTLTTANKGLKRFGASAIKISAVGRMSVNGYILANPNATIDATDLFYAGLSKALNNFFTENSVVTNNNIHVDVAKMLGAPVQSYAAHADLQPQLAKLNTLNGTRFGFKRAVVDYKQYRIDEGYNVERQKLRYYDVWEAQRVRNLAAEFDLDTLFNPALSGDALYQIRLDLAARANRLHRIVTYQGQPLFEIATNDDGTVSLKRLAQSTLVDHELTILATPKINAALTAAVTAIETARTTPEKVRALLASKELVQNTVDALRQQRRQRSFPFAATSAHAQPYAQYLAELRGYLAQIDLIGNPTSLQKLFAAGYLPLKEYLNFPSIDYYASRVYRDNYNPSVFGAVINPELVDLNLPPADYDAAIRKGAQVLGRVTRVNVFYDGQGQEITPLLNTSPFDNAIFDDKEFVYDSIKRTYPLVISRDFLFVTDEFNKEHLVASKISTIYEFVRDQTPTYFRTFESVYNYVKELITSLATKLG